MPEDESDAEIIVASLDNPLRFEGVFRRHFQPIRAYLQRRVGVVAGEDLAAETFLVAFDRRSSYDPKHRSARPWLFAIATNVLRHHLRDEARHAQVARTLSVIEPALVEGVDVDRLALREVFSNLLQELETVDREAFLLAVLGGLRYEEVADVLKLPIGTVRSKIHRARRHLRERLTELQDTESVESGNRDDG